MSELTFSIEKSAHQFVDDATFEADLFAAYLDKRGVPEEDICKTSISVDDSYKQNQLGMRDGTYGAYRPRDSKDPESLHQIYFSPTTLPQAVNAQGKCLRHESEHLIYQIHHPNHVRNKYIQVTAMTLAAGALGGASGVRQIASMSELWPEPLRVSAEGSAALLGFVAVGALGLMSEIMGANLNISEFHAVRAERKRKNELPDGTLQIRFKN